MQSYTTQSHQRNYQGNVVMPQANQTRSTKKRHKVLAGITAAVMALAITVTGGLLGATTIHNHQLKNEVQSLKIQAQNTIEKVEVPADDGQRPMTLELRPVDDTQTADAPQQHHHPKRRPIKKQPTQQA